MKLYILRHAIAEERDESVYPDDSQRPLTAKGKKKMVIIAENMKAMGIKIDLILTSPYVRAHETARIMVRAFGLEKSRMVLNDNLAPSGFAKDLIAEVNEKYQAEHLMLVGHEPYLSELISMLIAGDPSLSIVVKKGGLCCLSIENLVYDKCAALEWLWVPAQFAKMYRK